MATRSYLATFAALLALTPQCFALEQQHPCADEVQQCFTYTDARRDHCFQNAASGPTCANSELGNLARRRAEFSTLAPNDLDAGPSFLGPQLVDRACIANFDNSWSGAIVKGPLSKENYSSLLAALERCSRDQASDMMRP